MALVIDPAEMEGATAGLTGDGPTGYVILRVDEDDYESVIRGRSLRMLIEREGYVCRPPTVAEREAIEKGFEVLGVQVAHHWPRASL